MYDSKALGIKENVIWNGIGNIVYWGCSWLTTILIVRLSGYDDAGILALAMSICSTIYCISAYGVYNFQVSDIKGEYSSDSYMSTRIITALLGFVLCILVCFIQKYSVYQTGCILMYMLYKTVECFVNVIQAEEQKRDRMDLVAKSYIIRGIGGLICYVLGLHYTKNLFLTLCCMSIYSCIVYWIYDLGMIHGILGRKYILKKDSNNKRLLVACFPMALYWLFNTLTPTIPKLCIEGMMGAESLGYYASISSPLLVITMAANFILTPLISPLSVFFAMKKYRKFRNSIIRISIGIVICGGACYIIGRVAAAFFLEILYGKEILNYMSVAYNIILVILLSTIISFLNILFTIFRKLGVLVIINGGASVMALILCTIFIRKYGMQGANYALFVVYLLQILCMTFIFAKLCRGWNKQIMEERKNGC